MNKVIKFFFNKEGLTTIEFAMVAAALAATITAGLAILGPKVMTYLM